MVSLEVLKGLLTLIRPFKCLLKNLKKWQTLVSSFKDEPIKGSNLSGEGLNFLDVPWWLHIQYCLDFIKVFLNSPMRNHEPKKLTR